MCVVTVIGVALLYTLIGLWFAARAHRAGYREGWYDAKHSPDEHPADGPAHGT